MAPCAVLAVHDPNILYLLTRYVEESGLQAVVTGVAGLVDCAARRSAALVIVEAAAPASGDVAVQNLRARAETRCTPVLVYAPRGYVSGGGREPASDPATAYLQEYLMYDQFVAALRQVGVKAQAVAPARSLGSQGALA